MHLIVRSDPAYESSGQGIADIVVKHGKRARTDKDVRREAGSTAVSVIPVAVGRGIIYSSVLIPPVWILSRVEERRLAYGSSIGIVRIGHHTLDTDVKAQMLVQEVRAEIHIQCSSVVA